MVAFAILVLCVLATTGVVDYTGELQQFQPEIQAVENSFGGFGNEVSNGFSLLSGGLQIASGNGVAEIEAVSGVLITDTFTGDAPGVVMCATTPRNSYIQLANVGPGSGTAVSLKIASNGVNSNFAITGPCTLGPSGSSTATLYVVFSGLTELAGGAVPALGQHYVATVTLTDDVPVLFTGSFASGFSRVTVTSLALPAADFEQGQPADVTCVTTPIPESMFIVLTNTGTVDANVASITIEWKDTVNVFSISGFCSVGSDGTQSSVVYVYFGSSNWLGVPAEAGQSFTGMVMLSTGAQIQFGGKFQ